MRPAVFNVGTSVSLDAPTPWEYPERLRSSGEIRTVFGEGVRSHGALMVAHGRRRVPHDGYPARVAVVAGRKVGRAVDRNRAKRRLRAAVRHTGGPTGMDIVIVARRQVLSAAFPALCSALTRMLHEIERHGQQRGGR